MHSQHIPMNKLNGCADQVFQRYDTNRTGEIPMYMLPNMIREVSQMSGTACPSP